MKLHPARLNRLLLLAGAVFLASGVQAAPPLHAAPMVSAPAPAQVLRQLADDYWAYYLRSDPEAATLYGDYRQLDRLRTLTPAAFAQAEREAQALLRRAQALPEAGLGEMDRLDRALLLHVLRLRLQDYRAQLHLMPFNQYNGVQANLPGLVSTAPFETEAHYRAYLARLQQVPAYLAQARGLAQLGLRRGLTPPRALLDKVVVQCAGFAAATGMQSVFAAPLKKFPDDFSPALREELSQAILRAVNEQVLPAYAELGAWVQRDYAPKARTHAGFWALPQGQRLYAEAVAAQTTTRLGPDAIHALGLREVQRIEAEMTALARQHGYADLAALRHAIETDPWFRARSREEIVDDYRRYSAQIEPELPRLFGRLPKARLQVEAIPEVLEKDSSTSYQQGTVDGKRDGLVWVNTYQFDQISKASNEATAYHEGLPGHHLQISITQESPGAHPFHLSLSDELNAYVEGWALYAEGLAKELGFYQELVSEFGRLDSELFRAIRLVVDTGMHQRRWSRERAMDYFEAHTGQRWESEVDRYLVTPGQALGYKIGQLKLLELRRQAEQTLGPRFDVRAFHDLVLGAGPLPLDLLAQRVRVWVARQR
ncbi:DUF885 domain-containing protein [Paucibacter sp. AS339]|uniref:DUF885 domain-containing protein n=1 Tax=Paucibacter hankyongi TaxID=3133434 RepID=UPI00309E3036